MIYLEESARLLHLIQAMERAGMQPVLGFKQDAQGYIILDAASDLILQQLKVQGELGKPILAIGAGANSLVQAGMAPGLAYNKIAVSVSELHTPREQLFMRLSNEYQRNAFTGYFSLKQLFNIPAVHANHYYWRVSLALWLELEAQGLNVFQFCDEEGQIDEAINQIAALSNKAGNVLAIMPAIEALPLCELILQSIRDYIQQDCMLLAESVVPLNYYPKVMA